MVVASEDATFGLPEVDRGALGAATHLARLVPQHAMRAMVYTAATVTAAELRRLRLGRRGGAAGRPAGGGALELAAEHRHQEPDRHPRGPRSRSTASTPST